MISWRSGGQMRNVVQVVVVALLLVAAGGLLAVCVVKVREASARTQCANNLKQLALTIHNYNDTYERLPQAGEPNDSLPPDRRLSWLVSIGPFIEASDQFVRMDRKKGWDAEENRYLGLSVWKVNECPRARSLPRSSPFIPISYIGVTGLGEDSIWLPLSDPRAGLFGFDRKVSIKDIEAGLSTQLVALETTRLRGAWSAAGPPTARGLKQDEPYLGPRVQFGSLHRSGNAAMGDGSVRYFDFATNPELLESMAVLQRGAGKSAE